MCTLLWACNVCHYCSVSAYVLSLQDAMKCCEQKIDDHVTYEQLLHAALEWICTMSDQIATNSATTGDEPTVSLRLQRISELACLLPEGRARVDACVSAGAAVCRDWDRSHGWLSVAAGIDDLQSMWEQLEKDLSEAEKSLRGAVELWNTYKEDWRLLDEWLNDMEKSAKQNIMMADADEIMRVVNSFKVRFACCYCCCCEKTIQC